MQVLSYFWFYVNNFSLRDYLPLIVNPKTAGRSIWRPSGFSKEFFQCTFQRGGEGLLFMIFNLIISHIFSESFIEFPEVNQKICRFSFSFAISMIFVVFLAFFWHFFVTKKLMSSAYDRRRQHFVTFDLL